VHVQGSEVGQGPAALVLELRPARLSRSGWQVRMTTPEGLELALLIGADHVLVVAEPPTVETAGIQLQHRPALEPKSGSRGKIQDRHCHGLITSSAKILRTVDADTDATTPRPTAS